MSITVDGSTNTITSSAASISVTKPVVATSIQNTPIGSTTASTGAFTTLSASGTLTAGLITSNTASGNFLKSADTGTNQNNIQFINTGGTSYIGTNNSTGSFTTGGSAYNLIIISPNNNSYGIELATGALNTVRMTIDGTGLVSMLNGLAVTGTISATTTIKTGGYTVATLPAGVVGDRAYVTDATAPTYLGALTGGGAVVCPVFKNASAWVSA